MRAPVANDVFNEFNFARAFSADLDGAVMRIQIESAYVTIDGVQRFSGQLKSAVERGIRVCCFFQTPQYWNLRNELEFDPGQRAQIRKIEVAVNYLRELGVHTNLRESTHLKLAVIDYRVTWGGSLNILSYTQRTSEEIWRWTDRAWALDTIKRRNLEGCEDCQTSIKKYGDPHMTQENLGDRIKTLRKAAKLTQQQLANKASVSRELISDIENGRCKVQYDVVLRIASIFDQSLLLVPSEMAHRVAMFAIDSGG